MAGFPSSRGDDANPNLPGLSVTAGDKILFGPVSGCATFWIRPTAGAIDP